VISLEALVREARERGWTSAEGRLEAVISQAGHLGWVVVPSRKGGPALDSLRPLAAESAPSQSLSAIYGLGAQPLHTDGAHHPEPPDFLMLSVDAPSVVPTMLWRSPQPGTFRASAHDLRHGIFTVRGGSDAFLASAQDRGGIRFDPGCMTAADSRARRAVEYFEGVMGEAVRYDWTKAGQILVIDNRQVLHARGAAELEPERVIRRVAVRISGGLA
jgi:hypothetical protein